MCSHFVVKNPMIYDIRQGDRTSAQDQHLIMLISIYKMYKCLWKASWHLIRSCFFLVNSKLIVLFIYNLLLICNCPIMQLKYLLSYIYLLTSLCWFLMILKFNLPSSNVLQHRRLSYSRHAVDDRDLSTQVSTSQRQISKKKK